MTVQPTMRVRPPELGYETLGLIWREYPYSLTTLRLAKALRAAGYDACCGQEPSAVIVCPNGEDVDQEVKHLRDLTSDAPVLVLGLHNDPAVARAAL